MRERWQTQFDQIRRDRPIAWGRLASPRIVVIPESMARFYGGALTWVRWICVGAGLCAAAPDHVVRYVVAHEWGHVRKGHPAVALPILICAIITVVCPRTPQFALFGWGVGMLGLYLIVWATRLQREFEADDEAAQVVGNDGVREGLLWMVTHRAGGLNPDRRARLVRMGWNPTSAISNTQSAQRANS